MGKGCGTALYRALFQSLESEDVRTIVAGIALRHKDDEARLRDGAAALDALYEYFKRKR